MDDDVIVQLDRARSLVSEVVQLAGELLRPGTEAGRVHRHYVSKALDLLTEAETWSLLAASGDQSSFAALEDPVDQLSRLAREAAHELNRHSDRG
ncbi:MAG TPA: hypothetical protein VMB05_07375 [Solirubrobacteraceae bacterium]|nr:hypothetical protein [Solirubrobacteraceae bacterium]